MHFNELCSNRLQEERIRLGFTQTEIASQIGIRGGMWGRYERNEAAPGGDVLKAFADVGGDVQYVLTGEKSSPALAPDEKELLLSYRSLDVRGKAGLLGMIEGIENAETQQLTMLQRKSIATKVHLVASANNMQSLDVYQIIFADLAVESIANVTRDQYSAVMALLEQALSEVDAPSNKATKQKDGATVVFHGKVTQQITGDITAPQTNVFGSGKKKAKEEK